MRRRLLCKVYRLILGTHSHVIHRELRELLLADGWILIWETPRTRDEACVEQLYRGGSRPNRTVFDWPAVLRKRGCWHQTPRGPVTQFDGELILDNPRFVNRSRAMTMSDDTLRIEDLYTEPLAAREQQVEHKCRSGK